MSKRKSDRRLIPGGKRCPKCSGRMDRFEHGDDWKPKADQPYYYAYWDKCSPCRHIQLYDDAKILCKENVKHGKKTTVVREPPPCNEPWKEPVFLAQEGPPPWEDKPKEPPPWIIPLPLMDW